MSATATQETPGASDSHSESSEIQTRLVYVPKSSPPQVQVVRLASREWSTMVLSRTERMKPGASRRLIHCSLCCIPTVASGVLIGKEEVLCGCSPAVEVPTDHFSDYNDYYRFQNAYICTIRFFARGSNWATLQGRMVKLASGCYHL